MKPNQPILAAIAVLLWLHLHPYPTLSQGKNSTFVRAEDSFYDEDFETAFLLFNEYLDGSPKDGKAQYYAEICSLLTYYPTKSLEKFLSFEATLGKSDKFFYYWAGRIYAARYDYGAAMEAWEKFLGQKSYKSRIIAEETQAFIASAAINKAFIDLPSNYSVNQLPIPINTPYSEENPILFDNESKLMISSVGYENELRKKDRSTIYVFDRQGKNEWSKPVSYPAFREMKGSVVNLQLFDDETKLLLYSQDKKGDLYLSEKVNDIWGKPKPLSQVDREGIQASGFFTSNGEVLVYTAESLKGANDLDLFMVTKQGDQWSPPISLSELNTPFNEDSPYISPDGSTIYFSSMGHSSIGGFDVFKSILDDNTGKWGPPQNLGYPINTPADEIFFKFNKDGKTGFFSSNRAGSTGMLDAYLFLEEIKIPMKGRVIASTTGEPLAEVLVKVTPASEYLHTLTTKTDSDGNFNLLLTSGFDQSYELSYMGLPSTTEILSVSQVDPKDTLNKTFEIDVTQMLLAQHSRSEKVSNGNSLVAATSVSATGATISNATTIEGNSGSISEYTDLQDLGKKFSRGNKAVLRNIYFEPGSDYISSAYTPELFTLFELLSENPDLRIEIGGHTDAREEAISNPNLSRLRARSVGSYLIQRRIADSRIREVGYGYTQPLAASYMKENRNELNRRIEVLVIE